MYDIETHEVIRDNVTVTVRIVPDDDPMSPRDWDNLGVMFCHHRHYELGDVQIHPHEIERAGYDAEQVLKDLIAEHDPRVIVPLYLLDHSGLAMKAGPPRPGSRSPFVGDEAGWDTSMVGWIMDTAETREKMGIDDTYDSETIAGILHGEVGVYSTYLEGGVVGYIVEDEDGNHLDSCFGFYSLDDARGEGLDSAEYHADQLVPERNRDAAFRTAAEHSGLDDVSVPPGATVERTEGGAFVEARIFIPDEVASDVLERPATT